MPAEVISLGCRLNLSESEELRALLATADDTVVINSCAVTAEAVRQTRQAIRRARRANPAARLLVTGCAAEVERAALGAMPEVDGLVANAAKLDPQSVERCSGSAHAARGPYARLHRGTEWLRSCLHLLRHPARTRAQPVLVSGASAG